MDRRQFIALAGAAAAMPRIVFAQQARMPRVALADDAPASEMSLASPDLTWAALLQELADQGFVEGRTVILDRYTYRGAAAVQEDVRAILATNPDVIFWHGLTTHAVAATALSRTIPMVYTGADATLGGLVTNLARPGGNLTGISNIPVSAQGLRISLLAEVVPTAKICAWVNAGPAGQPIPVPEPATEAASKLGLTLIPMGRGDRETDIARTFDVIVAHQAEMVVWSAGAGGPPVAERALLADLALAAKLPMLGNWSAETGVLLGHQPDERTRGRLSGEYIALILKGANPGDLPILQPTTYHISVNMKTAKALGLAIPASILLRASGVFE